jgi:excisionase family DNA binding protein
MSSAFAPYMAVAEVAALLRTSAGAIYKMVERGQLPGVIRVGKRLLVERESLVHWLHQNRTPSSRGERR